MMRSRSTIAQGSAPRSLRSFTLLEILVVIGIIVIVASLVLAVSSAVARAGEQR
ncbi:MAG: prepilin-type N-terminal cleavage/methylation domain-containing protein, partial [Phycisphaerales bacterium]|nr:prepilin-type N-terminal cleavage/methylation domain-containing protein [Phycisphaerales bacterium]